ncbi:hypothetical protein NicSoilB8_23630 [Arthrobacter sp. NicSoilB8]|nr:hypothetical protein NicSoilB8_23630 [Arthrobacter sp. NicSoilB8]
MNASYGKAAVMGDNRHKPPAPGTVELVLVRHGESLGNVAATKARLSGAAVTDVPARDADVDLSPVGYDQATRWGALGRVSRMPSGTESPQPPVRLQATRPKRQPRKPGPPASKEARS